MQAEADKRSKAEVEQKRKAVREMLNADNTFLEKEGQHFDDVEWQPDWSKKTNEELRMLIKTLDGIIESRSDCNMSGITFLPMVAAVIIMCVHVVLKNTQWMISKTYLMLN